MDSETAKTPGEKLADLISNLISTDNYAAGDLLKYLDKLLMSDGEFSELIKNSIILYMVRRLIHGAWFTLKKSSIPHILSDQAIPTIRQYLQENYDFPDYELSNLTQVLYSCVCASNRRLSPAMRQEALDNFRTNGITSCYMCGVDVNFDTVEEKDSASVEHIFPRTYGGDSEAYNLALSCKDCNNLKDDHMDYADFHYERISTKYDIGDAGFKGKILREKNVIALWLKDDCKCSMCGKTAEEAGPLKIFKKNDMDSWHYLNIGVSCHAH